MHGHDEAERDGARAEEPRWPLDLFEDDVARDVWANMSTFCCGRVQRLWGYSLKRMYEMKKTDSAVLYSTPERFRSVARPSIFAFPMFARSRLETRYKRAKIGSIRMSIFTQEQAVSQSVSELDFFRSSDGIY